MQRRTFLLASAAGFAGLHFGRPRLTSAAESSPAAAGASLMGRTASASSGGRAKSTILFFLCGGASHLDAWDLKPQAPLEYRGPFQPIATSAPGVTFSEHLPLLAQQAHHLAVVNSLGHFGRGNNDHHAGYYYNLTGHEPDLSFRALNFNRQPMADDWPYIGTVAASRSPQHPFLPQAITLPHMPSRAPYTRPGQFAARLGVEHDPLYVQGNVDEPLNFQIPSLTLQGGVDTARLASRSQLLGALDDARREFDRATPIRRYSTQQEKAFSLLASSRTTAAFDVAGEPAAIRERYGATVNGMSLLLARRLVEAEVPFITVFWMENQGLAKKCRSAGGWDTHGNNFNCLKEDLLPEFDRGFSALVGDLSERGLLDQTMLLVTSEMGRKPMIGDRRSGGVSGAGRDHWTHCMTVLMAGGGIRGGQTYGSSDRLGEYPANKPCAPEDVAHTVYHAMGVQDLMAEDLQGRPYSLMEEGRPLLDLF